MKKLLLVLFIFAISAQSFSHTYVNGVPPPKFIKANSLAIQFGNSWANGYFSLEYQYSYLALSVGYRPANMPLSKDFFESFSTALTAYGSKYTDETTWYTTIGYASKGYYSEEKIVFDGEAEQYNPTTAPMLIGLLGYRFNYGNFSTKIGFGYGYSVEGSDVSIEILLRYIF